VLRCLFCVLIRCGVGPARANRSLWFFDMSLLCVGMSLLSGCRSVLCVDRSLLRVYKVWSAELRGAQGGEDP